MYYDEEWNDYRFDKEDIDCIKQMSIELSDAQQMEEAMNATNFYLWLPKGGNIDIKIDIEDAWNILGRETFISGIYRSAFHQTAVRENKNYTKQIYFDSSEFFKY